MATRKLDGYDLDKEEYIDADFIVGNVKMLADGSLEDADTGQTLWDAGSDHIPQAAIESPTIEDIADIFVDTEANLPAAGEADRIAFVHDKQEVQRDTGSSWETIANTSAGGASVSDDGTQVVASPSDVDYTTGLNASDDGDGTVSVNVEQEQVEDWVDQLLSANGNISLTYDDANDQLTIDTSGLNAEEVEDQVNQLLASSPNLSWSYDDANDTLTISLSGPITGVQIGDSNNRSDGYFSTVDTDQATITQVGGRGESTSTQSVGSGVTTVVELDASSFEDSDIIDVQTGNNRLVTQKAGTYLVEGALQYDDTLNDGTIVTAEVSVGGTRKTRERVTVGGSDATALNPVAVADAASGANIEMKTFHDHGSNRNLKGTEEVHLSAVLIG